MRSSAIKQGFLFFLLSFTAMASAQQRALGTWKMYLPYSSSLGVWDAGDKVYSAAPQSVFSYEKATGAVQVYDKANGLSDIGVKTIAYDAPSKFLVIAYNNSNIDLIYNGTDIYNISDIKQENVTGAVGINGLSFYNGNCYVSTDMGISVINLSRKEISNTYVIGSTGAAVKVFSASTDGNTIYAATAEGVKYAAFNAANLQDFNTWKPYSTASGLPAKPASHVVAYNGKAYAVIPGAAALDDTLYTFDGNTWQPSYSGANDAFIAMNATGGKVYFTIWNDVGGFHPKKGKIDNSGSITVTDANHYRPMAWFEDGNDYWGADIWGGMRKNDNLIVPSGPATANVWDIEIVDDVMYVAPGGVDDSWGLTNNSDGFFVYKNGEWSTRNEGNVPQMKDFYDIISIAPVPALGKTYFASFLSGVIEYDFNYGNIQTYTKNNSALEATQGDTQRSKVSVVAVDRHNNVWVANAGAFNPIKVITPGSSPQQWKKFSVPYNIAVIKKIVIDQNDQLWMPLRSVGVLVWSYGADLDNTADDRSKILMNGEGAGGLPDAITYCVVEDKDGNMWVGTNQGIAVYYCPGSVLSSSGCDADLIKVERDGYIGYLFGTESVRVIAVDAANRKWVGTTNGLWLISADGKTELLEFNTENSPLPTNLITDIEIEDKTGEVFIGTTGGMVSYMGDAVEVCEDCDGALVYPNPVKPDYNGPIAIKGLAENAYVKITDVSGKLVYQGKANGSQMIWDGKGYNGNRAKSGVYLVFSSTDLGKEKRVAKILLGN